MGRAVSGVPLLILWFITLVLAILAINLIVPELIRMKKQNFFIPTYSRNVLDQTKVDLKNQEDIDYLVLSSLKAGDVRVAIIEKFLRKYNSPMAGHGADFIAAADYYSLDWRLLPAIAFQESNLGKKIPKGSYNPFGWAVYTENSSGTNFTNWSEAIFTVAKGMRKNYIERGLSDPETIAIRYTENTNPTWIFAVKTAMAELSTNDLTF